MRTKGGKMPKQVDVEGVCVECGNTGLPGETCAFCGGQIEKIDPGIDDSAGGKILRQNEPETYPLDVLDQEEKSTKDVTAIDEE